MDKIAYTPYGKTEEIKGEIEIKEPNYPDAGIKFAGYYKKNLGGGNFELKPQTQIFFNTYFAAPTVQGLLFSVPVGKTYYITDIHISLTTAPGIQQFHQFEDNLSNLGTKYWRIAVPNSAFSTNLHFDVPLIFRTGCYWTTSLTQDGTFIFSGWEE